MLIFVGIFTILLGYCGAQKSNNLGKCSIFDSECQRVFFLDVIRNQFAKTGIPSIGIPIIEPLVLDTEEVDIFGLWNFTIYDALAEGISKCNLTYLKSDMFSRTKTLNMLCDKIVVRGRYKLVASPAVQHTNYNFNGDGYLTLTFDYWYFELIYPFVIVRHTDNQIYLEGEFEKAKNVSDVNNLTIQINGIRLGEPNIDEQSNSWLNTNWKMMMGSDIGKLIVKRAFEYYCISYRKFFTQVRASAYLSDDLTYYVSN